MREDGLPSVYQDYLLDLGQLIYEIAVESRERASITQSEYDLGYMLAMHRMVSLMQQQAEGFGISLDEIGLSEIDPDEYLV